LTCHNSRAQNWKQERFAPGYKFFCNCSVTDDLIVVYNTGSDNSYRGKAVARSTCQTRSAINATTRQRRVLVFYAVCVVEILKNVHCSVWKDSRQKL